ncbi:MAG: peptidoglycan DD-metalloendopeptidase family protein [Flavobacteriales bacterium]|nr:peptidoglycan DD-metalloendopeptidase family protein [Flavobacteriales bacterium]MCB9335966.1 peptidoglycan DD-metalloendopeptidase family protein [Flavobacteriales bacterium]
MDYFKNILFHFLLVVCFTQLAYANNNEENKTKKDTVSALVITPKNPLYNNLSSLSGNEIINLIDSLLDQKDVPKSLIRELNDYAESRLLEHDFYVSLTNYYEDSPIPSNSMYGNWDTKSILPYDNSISENDTSLILTLTDTANFCNFVNPIHDPVVTSNFGWRDGKNHNGIDLDLQVWDPVVAAFDGMVRVALYHPGYGRVVVIRHYNGLETLYAHLHRLKVKSGDIVEAGQLIGLGGSSGHSTGSHLHFEVRFKGKPLNPKHLISFKKNELISDSLKLIKQKYSYTALPLGVEYHTIQRGDFMYKIADRYGISVKELCELNGMKRNSVLIVGRKLRIN